LEAQTEGERVVNEADADRGDRSSPSFWRDEYARRHCLDVRASRRMRLVLRGQTTGHDPPWPALLLEGDDAFDLFLGVALRGADALDGPLEGDSSVEGDPGGVGTSDPHRRDVDDGIRVLARQILVAINRFEVFREWRDLILVDVSARSGGEDSDGDGHRNAGDANQFPSIEDGAILLARFYLTADDLIRLGTLDGFEADISIRIEELGGQLRDRLEQRRIESSASAANDCNGGSETAMTYPLLVVFEEMRSFFTDLEQGSPGEIDGEKEVETLAGWQAQTKFVGNASNYYDYRNSLLDQVLSTGKGIPISLSVLYAAIVNRATGIVLEGIGLPGHFILAPSSSTAATSNDLAPVFVDPFHGGKVLSLENCRHIVQRFGISWDEQMLRHVKNAEVWSRMVRNLANCHMIDLRSFDPNDDNRSVEEERVMFATKIMNGILHLASDDILRLSDADLARQHALYRQFC